MTAMPVTLKLNCIPQLSTTSWRFILCYGMTTAGVAIANNALISLGARVFPVPFTQFAPTVPMALIGVLLNRFFLKKPEVQERAEKIDQWLAMDIVPICVYPVFTAVFMAIKPAQQLWLSLLLPVIKRLLRYVVWLIMKDDFDLVGPTTCSVVHLYHTLFTAMCLQNAKSMETLAAIVMVNTLQMLLNCRDIFKDAEKLKRTRKQLENMTSTHDDVVSTALEMANQHQVATLLHRKSPSRLVSKYPGYQTLSFQSRYHDLLLETDPARIANTSSMDRSIRRSSRHRSQLTTKGVSPPSVEQNFTQIIPWMDKSATFSGKSIRMARTQSRENHTRLSETYVISVTSALHQTEIILLRSYITVFMLFFYGIYLVVVYWLPNRRYFATMSTMTTFEAVDSILFHFLLLGGFELGFLATYLVLISYQLEVSGLRQLAFVLWSQRVLLQAKFISLSLMILGFPLEHYGNGIIYKLRTG
ncbi:hypothetical protein DVH05_016337 [Phytophthora capsici]|nr:hypothetical protein DVH05_016337 [Phytophthora capsici]